jgi:hypothetical protein
LAVEGRVQPVFDLPYVNVVATFANPYSNVAFGSHCDEKMLISYSIDYADADLYIL